MGTGNDVRSGTIATGLVLVVMRNTKDAIICPCSGTTYQKIANLLANGVTTLEDIANITGATTGCGSCDYLVLDLVKQHAKDTVLEHLNTQAFAE